MVTISQGESCKIPEGFDDAVVTNTDANQSGSYDLSGDGIGINKQIPASATQRTPIFKNATTVTNSGKAVLNVPDGE